MIKNWIKKIIGITKLELKTKALETDIMVIMEKQLGQEMETLPIDAPEVGIATKYEYILDPSRRKDSGWYVIWYVGFAGPFTTKDMAEEYKYKNNLTEKQFCEIERLTPYQFEKKK